MSVQRITRAGNVSVTDKVTKKVLWTKRVEITFVIDSENPAAIAMKDEWAIAHGMVQAATRLRTMGGDTGNGCPDKYDYVLGQALPKGFQSIDPMKAAEKLTDEQLKAILAARGIRI